MRSSKTLMVEALAKYVFPVVGVLTLHSVLADVADVDSALVSPASVPYDDCFALVREITCAIEWVRPPRNLSLHEPNRYFALTKMYSRCNSTKGAFRPQLQKARNPTYPKLYCV